MAKNKSKFRQAYEEAYGIQPTKVKGIFNLRTDYYRMQLERIAMSIIDIDYNEDLYTWDKDYMREALLLKGLMIMTKTKPSSGSISGVEDILLPLKGGATGINVFNRPTQVIVANPIIGSFERTIGVDCEIVYLQSKQGSRYRSIRPILDVFAQKLANCDAAIDINVFNSRTPFIFQAPSESVAESFKAMFDEISDGNPAVFVDEEMGNLLQNKEGSNFYQLKGKENFVADVVQLEKHEIMNEFLTAIGINNANMQKREREVVDEVNSNNVAIKANIKLWKENVETCVDRVNKMFPDCNLKITFPYYCDECEESVDRPQESEVEDEPTRQS